MIQSLRFCQHQGHEQQQSSLVCTFSNCTENIKWVCPECLRKQLHQHGQQNNDHIMNQKEFLEFIDQNNQMDVMNQCKIQLNTLIKSINQFSEHMKNNYEMKNIIQVVKDDFLSLSNDQISIAQNLQQCDHNQINQNFLNIIQQAQVFEQQIDIENFSFTKQVQTNQNLISHIQDNAKSTIQNQNLDNQIHTNVDGCQYQNLEYENYIQFERIQYQYIRYALISHNEKYLALCQDKKLIIYNLEEKRQIKEITLDQDTYYCLFNQSSTIIYIGCDNGFLYSSELENIQLITYYDEEVYLFNNFILEDSYQIIYSQNRNICEIDFQKKLRYLLVENAHSDYIVQIQYDKINKIIVSCSNDKFIKFFSEQGDTIINQESHQSKIIQIQLINNNSQLLSLCFNGILSFWQICLEKRQIQQLGQLNCESRTLSFNSVYNDRYIIIQSEYNLELIDAQFKYIKQISSSDKDQIRDTVNLKQLDSMNYIIVLRYSQVTIMQQIKN